VALWAGFGAAPVALVVLLFFQYRWLTELERSAALARRAILTKVLDVVSKEAHGEIKSAAEPGFHVDALDLSDAGLARLDALLVPREGEQSSVYVGNERGEPVLPGSRRMPKNHSAAARRPNAPFSDWWIAVQARRSSAERLARRNYALNTSLSLALALLGGTTSTRPASGSGRQGRGLSADPGRALLRVPRAANTTRD
jgi:hypothetical protein